MASTPDRLAGNVAIVTGSTRGIGAEIARRFAREGATVVVCGRTDSRGEAVADEITRDGGRAIYAPVDVRDPEMIKDLVATTVDEFGHLDVLVNNAAVQTETSVTDVTLEEWGRVIETDFRAYWLTAKHAAKTMDSGSIINISSNHAYTTMPDHFPYNAVKSAINGMTRAMALDLGPSIRVNTINPGWIEVERTTEGMTAETRSHLESIHPVGRIGTPADVAGVAAFLASDDAAFVTGASVLVDGGRSAVMQDNSLPDYAAERSE